MIPCCFTKFEWHAFEESWRGVRAHLGAMKPDRETLTCLRSVLMKPEHFDWVERIWKLLSASADESLDTRH